jgi:flagellar hook-length control protein FliK
MELILHEQSTGSFSQNQPGSGRHQIRPTEGRPTTSTQATTNLWRSAESGSAASSGTEPLSASQPKDLIYQVAERIQFQIREGKGEMRIQLKPDGLGRLEIKAQTTANGVVARISTETSSMKTYLESNLQLLQQNLQDQGLKVERIQVIVQNESDSQAASGHQSQFSHAGTDSSARESNKTSAMSKAETHDVADDTFIDPAALIDLNPNVRFHTVA